MIETDAIQGLCGTCAVSRNCTFLDGTARPVWQCEEFMGENHTTSVKPGNVRKNAGGERAPGVDLKSARGLGICSSCEKLADCTFPQAGMGVVYCEEYQRNSDG